MTSNLLPFEISLVTDFKTMFRTPFVGIVAFIIHVHHEFRVHVYIYIYIYIYMCVCVCVCVGIYIYIYILFFLLWRCNPPRVMPSSFLRFLDHTQRRTTFGRTPLDE